MLNKRMQLKKAIFKQPNHVMRYLYLTLYLLLTGSAITNAQVKFNGDLENINRKAKVPAGWEYNMGNGYDYLLDSTVVKEGKYSFSIASKPGSTSFGAISCFVPQTFAGSKLQLKVFIKIENVVGYAGLYVRIDGTSAFNNMYDQNIKGTADWKEYTINLPYDGDSAEQIAVGALLAGTGKIWFDDVRLYIDDILVEQAALKAPVKAKTDKSFSNSSGIQSINTDPQTLKNLALLAQVWGFVKYHSPAVAKGDFNMDAELFRVMPAVLKATDTKQACDAIEQWVDKLGAPAACNNCKPAIKGKVMIKPDYGDIFNNKVVSASLINKLKFILDNSNITKNYYLEMKTGTNNPVFKNEPTYANVQYIDTGLRLLSLFRYWNMFQYFSPYRDITGQNWNDVLYEFIPKFIAAKADIDYQLATLSLIAKVNDTHANVWSNLKALNQYKGNLVAPFLANFIEDKLVVTGFYRDTLKVKDNFKIGDVITSINGVQVKDLIKRNLPYTAASNYTTQLRDMPSTILRFNDTVSTYSVIRDKKTMAISQRNAQRGQLYYNMFNTLKPGEPGFKLINDQLGYLYPGGYHSKDLPAMKAMFDKTKALIIDMRCYPSEFMPFTFVPYIKKEKNKFVHFSRGRINSPGTFILDDGVEGPADGQYKGKVIVIVNAVTQSQAEYTTMALQSSPNVTVIGSTTAGADGDVSYIILPGGISTMISGLGVFYPDGTPTQRKGVKIDIVVKPTIAGIKAGRDELLEKAMEVALK
jgi:hypothetical protein